MSWVTGGVKEPGSWQNLELNSVGEMLRCRPVQCGPRTPWEKRGLFEAWETFRKGLVDAAERGFPAELEAKGTLRREEWVRDACRLMTYILVVCAAIRQGTRKKPIVIDLQKLDEKFHFNGLLNEYGPKGLAGQRGMSLVLKKLTQLANTLSTATYSTVECCDKATAQGGKRTCYTEKVVVKPNLYNGQYAYEVELDRVVEKFPADLVDPAGYGESLKQLLEEYLTKEEPLLWVWRAMVMVSDDDWVREHAVKVIVLQRAAFIYKNSRGDENADWETPIRGIEAVNRLIRWAGKPLGLDRRHYINAKLLSARWYVDISGSFTENWLYLWRDCIQPHLWRCLEGKDEKKARQFMRLCEDAFAPPTENDIENEEKLFMYEQEMELWYWLGSKEGFTDLTMQELHGLVVAASLWNEYAWENRKEDEYPLTRRSYLLMEDFEAVPQDCASDLKKIKQWLWNERILKRMLEDMDIEYDDFFADGDNDQNENYTYEREFLAECRECFYKPLYVAEAVFPDLKKMAETPGYLNKLREVRAKARLTDAI